MATTYGRKKQNQTNMLYTLIAAILICALFVLMLGFVYVKAENEAYEMLHLQTKQIKDDLILQMKSDKENLITMANFAAKLYAGGESYSLMFDSFKPIGLFSRIGILNPDGTFITKDGTYDLSGKISFEKEAMKGAHITGRTPSYSIPGEEVIRSVVPIQVDGETVGLIYGIIKIENINEKYGQMAQELNAQLFVYDKESGKYVIDTINQNSGNVSELKTRKYNDGYSYEQLITTDKGFTSFQSIRSGENLYVHYSTIEDFNWGIILARYETQVFEKADSISHVLFFTFIIMIMIIAMYVYVIFKSERNRIKATAKASAIRKLLLEMNQQQGNLIEALQNIQEFSQSRSAFFVDTDGEEFHYILPDFENYLSAGVKRNYFVSELFRYAAELHNVNKRAIEIMRIIPDHHLEKTNPELYRFSNENCIKEVSFAIITDKKNHVSILGVINPEKSVISRVLLEDIAVCFSIAIYNKKHLNKTEIAATTDSLTGALNRVSYKKDLLLIDEEKPEHFSCIYIDVNELHIKNNKYGHAAGDEMLIYIVNTLKEVFFGHRIYRMGGDEFLVFAGNTAKEQIKEKLEAFTEQLKPKEYNVAIGVSYRSQNANCEEMVREAEIRMYEAKAQYYQNKEQNTIADDVDDKYIQTKTGIREIDTLLSVLKENYNGIYRVTLDTDLAHRILMPSYLGYHEKEEHFSKLLAKYIDDFVHPDFHRAVTSFLSYDVIKRQMAEGKSPTITYKKTNGENVVLSIYHLDDNTEDVKETLWVFAKV